MLLTANKARSLLTGSVTSAAGQVAAITASSGALFVGVGGIATSTGNPMRCVLTAVDANGNDTGAYEIVNVTRSGDNLTLVSRGLEGTTAASWSAGTVIECRPTAGTPLVMGPQGVISGVGTSGLTATTMTSQLPGGTAISIPGGTLAAGDAVILEAVWGHVGTTTAWTLDIIFNGTNSAHSFFGPTASNKSAWTRAVLPSGRRRSRPSAASSAPGAACSPRTTSGR